MRCRRRTGWPTASSIRFTWCLRPSWSVELDPPAGEPASPGGRRAAVLELDALRRAGERLRGRVALDLGDVDLLDLVARVGEPVGELAVVREEQRAGRVGVEPADRDDARGVVDERRRPSAARGSRAVVTTPAGLWSRT